MKKLVFAAIATLSVVALADHADVRADASGYYDVTLTTKRLTHSDKTVKKTFTTTTSKSATTYAWQKFKPHYDSVKDLAGFKVILLQADGVVLDPESGMVTAKKIQFNYSYYNFKETKVYSGSGKSKVLVRIDTNYVTKVVSESYKGVYDAEGDEEGSAKPGMVYLWSTASSAKVSVTNDGPNAIVESKQKKGVEQWQSGYAVYQVPLAMHKQFVGTQDNKAAGGFTGGVATAENDTELDFAGFTAFGTGTLKNDELYSVSGNVAMKNPDDVKYGAYGTWKIQKDTSSATKKISRDIKSVLRNKKCVELFMERGE